jgi:hypothetical protein
LRDGRVAIVEGAESDGAAATGVGESADASGVALGAVHVIAASCAVAVSAFS